ncbi:carbon-monoxide dehydrogenase small subunit [Proteiniborus ethanoligenes]|uniref:Carbon-monoxide dehydrogenase small subunit n=1 Tax=Proteiniborus ethanoligenes TaxID=415015 RepID=A0A1H3MJQ7_9FIRM|nr:(2Fe-2S)-binding protein [Proteiniborus ethanoligenes]SDY76826.1 carbon-monoxide dehydrogenase small subunit [Proteiniborus ethanoligenes]
MIAYKDYTSVILNVNGEKRKAIIKPSDTLLRVLREELGLTGAKPGCENGDCGACTILLDGKPVKSCMMLAVEAIGMEIITIEGLNNTEIQQAFYEEGGFQCGYCTPGFLLNSYALLEEKPDAEDEEIKEWLKSNLCRCTGYEGIKNAVYSAKEKIKER